MTEWTKNDVDKWFTESFSARRQKQLEEAEARANLLIQMANNIMDLSARNSLLERRVEQLEARLIIMSTTHEFGKLEERVGQLEDNTAKYYSINEQQLSRMLENLVRRVDRIEGRN